MSGAEAAAPTIRPFRPGDVAACMALFDSNVPAYFAPQERGEFSAFLADVMAGKSPYRVICLDGTVVGCGGLVVEPDQRRASLAWGMVDRSFHRQGLGTVLTEARVALARSLSGVTELRLATSQHSAPFYARFGFACLGVTPDGLAPGLDLWEMALSLR
ncbi:MAG: GNAT family N-acetyltransferase [Paracoccaceae bacterium]